jgi:hypothetical protein
MPLDAEALYVQLGRLVETMPDLEAGMPFPPETDKWFGRAYALVRVVNLVDAVQFGLAVTKAKSYHTKIHDEGCNEIRDIIYRNLAVAELDAPASAQGAFVPAGNAFDAFAGIGKVLGAAKRDLLIS